MVTKLAKYERTAQNRTSYCCHICGPASRSGESKKEVCWLV
uniref:Uncharacterized protein n=1 Tax=Anguilla anguilla TaxID=7936 RepID=A0A0E9PBT8_ANGAN